MGYLILAAVTMGIHFGYLAYLVAGGFLAWRWRWTIWLHLVAVLWALGSLAIGYECPLTHLENWARRRGGVEPLPPSGFIDHYLADRLYPHAAEAQVRLLAGFAVLTSWVGFGVLGRRRRGARSGTG